MAPGGLPAQTPAEVTALRQRADSGDPEAQVALGNLFAAGRGVAADPAQAVRWYRQAAEKGIAAAHFNLGLAYDAGRGVAVDERQAFRHYLMAAEQGLAAAQFNVGNMYANGRGVAQDAFEANIWFRQAAEKGVVEAQYNLGLAYEAGRGVRKDESQGARWLQLAADRGFAQAQFRLGVMREEGRGGTENPAAAAALYRAAAEQGFPPAQNNLGLLIAQGAPGVAKDAVQGYAWLLLAAESGLPAPGREVVAQSLSEQERSAAARVVSDLRAGIRTPGSAPAANTGSAAPDQAYVDGLEDLVSKLRAANEELANTNQRLVAEKSQAAAAGNDPDLRVRNLERDNERLNDEVKRATRELLSLNSQLRTAREQRPAGETGDTALKQENSRLARAAADAEQKARQAETDLAAARGQVEALETDLAAAQERLRGQERPADTGLRTQLVEVNAALEKSEASVAELTGENDRLERELAAVRQQLQTGGGARDEAARLARENEQLRSAADDNRELQAARREIAALENRLREALAPRPSGSDDAAVEKLEAQVAELTGENDRLERDLENTRKAVDAALAAQQQAVTAARPDAYQMEIRTLQDRVKQLEATLEDDRGNSARELATVAGQLQRTREANRALTEANRALLAAQQSADTPTRAEVDEAQARIRDLVTAGDEMRRQVQALSEGKAVAEERADKVAAELAALQARVAEADKAAESHGSAVAELTGENEKLAQARDALTRQLEALRAEVAQHQQTSQSAERQRVEAERSASLNVNAMAAQLAELRRDLEATRTQNARLIESNTALERERSTTMARLRNENAALTARLSQAQSTLDQIASAARLGTPASQIAAGGQVVNPVPVASAPLAEPRFHTVADGDSLSRISLRYYGTAARWQEIFEANREELRGANTLRVGQRLRIP